jgi:hypothetical protein
VPWGRAAFWFNITIPLIGCGNSPLIQHCKLARSTGAAINQGQETATQHDRGAFGKDTFFLPQKRLRN